MFPNAVTRVTFAQFVTCLIDDMQMAQTYSINTILRHPLYRGRGVFHDVALIHTIEEIQFNQQTKPICMTIVPGAQDVEQDDQVQVAGWGYVDDSLNKTASDTLQETTLQVLNRSECQSKSGFNNDLIFCVGNPVSTIFQTTSIFTYEHGV